MVPSLYARQLARLGVLGSCALICGQALAAPAHITGQVVDADLGEPIAGIEVFVAGRPETAITDSQGRFVLHTPVLPALVVVEGSMIERTQVQVQKEGEHLPLLIKASYAQDQSVMVVASRVAPLTASTRSVSAKEFRAVPRRTAEDALQLVPGFTLVQHGSEGKGHQFFLRGFDAIHGSDLELSVEGVVINEWSNIHAQGYLDVAFVIPESIESVEVTKGPFTLGQGAFAMAGSAKYELGIAPEERGVRMAYTFGTTMRHRGVVTYSPKQGDGEDFVAAEVLTDKGFGVNRGMSRASALGRWRVMKSQRAGDLAVMASAYTAKFELPGTLRNQDYLAGRVGFFDAYDRGARGKSERAILGLDHHYASGKHRLKTRLYAMGRRLYLLENYTGFLVDPLHGDRRQQAQDTVSSSLALDYDYRVNDSLGVLASAGARGEWFDQAQKRVDMQGRIVQAERDLKGFQSLANVAVGVRYHYKDRFWLAGAARVDVVDIDIHDRLETDEEFKDNGGRRMTLSPRLTAEFKVAIPLRFFAAYGRGFRPPEARSFSSFVPGQKGIQDDVFDGGDPENVTDDAVELGLRWMPSRYFAATAAAFGTFLRRETVFDHVSGVNLELNGTRRLGGEIELHSSPLDGLTLSADLTYVDARFMASGKKVPLSPWLTGSAKAMYHHKSGFRAGLYFMAVAPRPLPHNASGGTLAVLDATAGYSWKWLHFDLELENALNRKVREGEYHYASHWEQGKAASKLPVVHFVAGSPFNARLTASVVF